MSRGVNRAALPRIRTPSGRGRGRELALADHRRLGDDLLVVHDGLGGRRGGGGRRRGGGQVVSSLGRLGRRRRRRDRGVVRVHVVHRGWVATDAADARRGVASDPSARRFSALARSSRSSRSSSSSSVRFGASTRGRRRRRRHLELCHRRAHLGPTRRLRGQPLERVLGHRGESLRRGHRRDSRSLCGSLRLVIRRVLRSLGGGPPGVVGGVRVRVVAARRGGHPGRRGHPGRHRLRHRGGSRRVCLAHGGGSRGLGRGGGGGVRLVLLLVDLRGVGVVGCVRVVRIERLGLGLRAGRRWLRHRRSLSGVRAPVAIPALITALRPRTVGVAVRCRGADAAIGRARRPRARDGCSPLRRFDRCVREVGPRVFCARQARDLDRVSNF